jgi:hypothetical protein
VSANQFSGRITHFVIPAERERGPESITTNHHAPISEPNASGCDYGFRARHFVAPRNDRSFPRRILPIPLPLRERVARSRQRVRPEVAGPMTSSARAGIHNHESSRTNLRTKRVAP